MGRGDVLDSKPLFCYSFSVLNILLWSHRLAARTPGSHPGNPGSIPGGITKENSSALCGLGYFLLLDIYPAELSLEGLITTNRAEKLPLSFSEREAVIFIIFPAGSPKIFNIAPLSKTRYHK